jgi:hypothetical protein
MRETNFTLTFRNKNYENNKSVMGQNKEKHLE